MADRGDFATWATQAVDAAGLSGTAMEDVVTGYIDVLMAARACDVSRIFQRIENVAHLKQAALRELSREPGAPRLDAAIRALHSIEGRALRALEDALADECLCRRMAGG